MKVIIAGSRGISDFKQLESVMDDCPWKLDIEEVVCGCAKGVDLMGAEWALLYGIPVKFFDPDWERYGKRAGIIRNREMGNYADALVALWDGVSNGTTHMIGYMKHLGKPYIIRQFQPTKPE